MTNEREQFHEMIKQLFPSDIMLGKQGVTKLVVLQADNDCWETHDEKLRREKNTIFLVFKTGRTPDEGIHDFTEKFGDLYLTTILDDYRSFPHTRIHLDELWETSFFHAEATLDDIVNEARVKLEKVIQNILLVNLRSLFLFMRGTSIKNEEQVNYKFRTFPTTFSKNRSTLEAAFCFCVYPNQGRKSIANMRRLLKLYKKIIVLERYTRSLEKISQVLSNLNTRDDVISELSEIYRKKCRAEYEKVQHIFNPPKKSEE